jgi:hypothetical protein
VEEKEDDCMNNVDKLSEERAMYDLQKENEKLKKRLENYNHHEMIIEKISDTIFVLIFGFLYFFCVANITELANIGLNVLIYNSNDIYAYINAGIWAFSYLFLYVSGIVWVLWSFADIFEDNIRNLLARCKKWMHSSTSEEEKPDEFSELDDVLDEKLAAKLAPYLDEKWLKKTGLVQKPLQPRDEFGRFAKKQDVKK